jgi:hypothetical protein
LEGHRIEKVGKFCGHLEYFTVILCILWPLGNVVVIWYIFPRFGILCQEKSGNTALAARPSKPSKSHERERKMIKRARETIWWIRFSRNLRTKHWNARPSNAYVYNFRFFVKLFRELYRSQICTFCLHFLMKFSPQKFAR